MRPTQAVEERIAEMIKPDINRGASVFVWATGQDDNLGDSLLRRAYLSRLREVGMLAIWVGSASSAFKSGLGLTHGDQVHERYRAWYTGALKSAARGRTFIAINAGEVPVSKRGAVRMASLAVLIIAAQVRGGGGIWLGAGVPAPKKLPYLVPIYKVVAKLCKQSRFRDKESLAVVGSANHMPDWAFALGTPVESWKTTGQRRCLGIVMRGDRPHPDAVWGEWVKQTAACLELEIVVVIQVQRDTAMATRLADALGGSVAQFEFDDHSSLEAAVRHVYSNCAIVIGDRLHGLIVAATEGAVPLGWVPSSRGKIARHFDVVGFGWAGRWEGHQAEKYDVIVADGLEQLRVCLEEGIYAARSSIEVVASKLPERALSSVVTSGE